MFAMFGTFGHLEHRSAGKRFAYGPVPYGTGIGRSAKRGAGKNPPGFR